MYKNSTRFFNMSSKKDLNKIYSKRNTPGHIIFSY